MQRRSLLSAGSLRWKCCLTNGMYNCRTRQPPLSGVVSSRSSERLNVSFPCRYAYAKYRLAYSTVIVRMMLAQPPRSLSVHGFG